MAEETQDPQELNETPPETAEDTPEAADVSPEDEQAPAAEAVDEEAVDAAEEATDETTEDEGPDFGVEIEDIGTLKRKVTITVPAEMIDAKRDEMFGELSQSAQVPGFRIGRAPKRLLVKRFGKDVDQDVRNALIGESLGKGLEKSGLHVLGEPDLDLDAIELPDTGDMTFDVEVEVAPEFELPELEGIEIERPSIEITDERIDETLERMRLQEARYEETDEAAAEQDVVEVTAKITGEGIDETETTVTLRVAPGQVEGLPLVDLGKELAGKSAGETATLTVKVPDVHPNESWQGKEASVELTVNQVRKRVLPEIDEQYAKDRGYESLEEVRESISGRMAAQIDMEVRRAMRDQINEYLLENTECDVPEGVASRQAASMLQRRYVDLMQAGISQQQVEERMTQIQASVAQEAQRELKLSFIFQKIADQQEIEVTEEEINSRVAQMATAYGRRPERLRQELASDGSLEQVGVGIREEKVTQTLLDKANVIELSSASKAESADKDSTADEPAPEEPAGAEADEKEDEKE